MAIRRLSLEWTVTGLTNGRELRVRGAGGERGRRRPGDVGDSDALHHARRGRCT